MASTYLTKQSPTAGNRTKGTISMWVKRSGIGSTQYIYTEYLNGTDNGVVYFAGGNTLDIISYNGSSAEMHLATNRLFRDTNAWYHLVFAWDTSQGTAADRVKMYINGVQETSFSTATYPSQNSNLKFGLGSSYHIYIGQKGSSADYFDGCMSHVHRVDNQQLNASVFGSFDSVTGEWSINTSPSITYTGSSSFNFFVLKDGNSVTDQSGQSNNLTVGGGTLTKTEDNPSNVFATLNPLQKLGNSNTSLTYGNTRYYTTSSAWGNITSTLGFSSGKFYVEGKVMTLNSSTGYGSMGIIDSTRATQTTGNESFTATGNTAGMVLDYRSGQSHMQSAGSTVSSNIGDFSNNDIIGMAIDMDNKALYIHKAGTYYQIGGVTGVPTSGASKTGAITIPSGVETCMIAMGSYTSNADFCYNFGNGYFLTTAVATNSGNGYAGAEGSSIFNYQPPTGYSALSTKGLNT